MADSNKWFNYLDDNGNSYSIFNDESKGEAALSSGGTALDPFVAGSGTLPRGIKPRYVNCIDSANPGRTAQIKIGTQARYAAISDGAVIGEAGGITWRVTSKRAERRRLASALDTGLIDGDQP